MFESGRRRSEPALDAGALSEQDIGGGEVRPGGRRRPVALPVVLAVAAGGALGAPARYEVELIVNSPAGTFPWATFWINLTGSFVLGALLTLVIARWPPSRYVRPFFASGFIGAYTTWSTFVVETDELMAHGHAGVAATYVVASLVGGLAAVWAGVTAVRALPSAAPMLEGAEE